MTAIDSHFSGSVPQNYHAQLVPMIFEDYADDIVGRLNIPRTGAVLETACGTGVVSGRLRAALDPSIKVTSTDLNEPMLDVAKAELAGQDIEFQIADATDLPFDDASFDAVVCQFGTMFFPDLAKGFAEAARVLRPGGSFIFSIWDGLEQNPISQCAHEAVCEVLPDNPPQFLTIPFPIGGPDLTDLVRQLQAAGFGQVRFTVLEFPCRADSARTAASAVTKASPLTAQLAERDAVDSVTDAAEKKIAAKYGSGQVVAPMQAIVIEADLAS